MVRALGMALAGLVALMAWCLALPSSSVEPVYAGKRLTEWLDAGAEPAAWAVREIGPSATPWILEKLRHEHPRWGRRQYYCRGWQQLPSILQRFLPRPRPAGFDEFRAATLLVAIGPSVIPDLAAALKENNPAVRISCALALGVFRQAGKGDSRMLPALRGALVDEHLEVREQVRRAIGADERRRSP